MTSIKLKFRAHTDSTKEGTLYFQVIHDRTVKQVKTDYHIYECEWDKQHGNIVKDFSFNTERNEVLKIIRDKVLWEQRKLKQIVKVLEDASKPYTANDFIRHYKESASDKTTVFEYMCRQSERMMKLGRVRTGETYRQTLRSFMRFRNGVDLYFNMLDADMVEQYESFMRSNNLSRNSRATSRPINSNRRISNLPTSSPLRHPLLQPRRFRTTIPTTCRSKIFDCLSVKRLSAFADRRSYIIKI